MLRFDESVFSIQRIQYSDQIDTLVNNSNHPHTMYHRKIQNRCPHSDSASLTKQILRSLNPTVQNLGACKRSVHCLDLSYSNDTHTNPSVQNLGSWNGLHSVGSCSTSRSWLYQERIVQIPDAPKAFSEAKTKEFFSIKKTKTTSCALWAEIDFHLLPMKIFAETELF